MSMKVKDLIEKLSCMNPNDDVVLKHLYSSPEVIMKKIRVYSWEDRIIIDGYEKEALGAEN